MPDRVRLDLGDAPKGVPVLPGAGSSNKIGWGLNFCGGRFFREGDAPGCFKFDHGRTGYPEIFLVNDPGHTERQRLGRLLDTRTVAANHFEREFLARRDAARHLKTATVVADVARASLNLKWRACGIFTGDFQVELKADAFAAAAIFECFAERLAQLICTLMRLFLF